MEQDQLDETLGILRCVSCSHRLEDEIECPFCSAMSDQKIKPRIPKWIFVTACFLTSPLSLYPVIIARQLNAIEKVLTFSGCLFWFGIYQLI
jgi:hypothetical protein